MSPLPFQHEPGDTPQGLPVLLPGSQIQMLTRPNRYVYLAYRAMSQTGRWWGSCPAGEPASRAEEGVTPPLLLTVMTWEDRLSAASSLDTPHARNENLDVNSFGFERWRLIRLLKSAKQNISVDQSHSLGQQFAAPGL